MVIGTAWMVTHSKGSNEWVKITANFRHTKSAVSKENNKV